MNEKVKNILEWVYCIVIALVIAFLIKGFIGTPTVVEQRSMTPTFEPGNRLILNKWCRTIKSEIKRGDVITFEAPINNEVAADPKNPIAKYNPKPKNIFSQFAYYSLEIGKTSYIKRVIGLPGEHVVIKDGAVYINDKKLDESAYLNENVVTEAAGPYYDIVVPENTVFAMGDNRGGSSDCRSFGCIPFDKVESRVVLRVWPLNKWSTVKRVEYKDN